MFLSIYNDFENRNWLITKKCYLVYAHWLHFRNNNIGNSNPIVNSMVCHIESNCYTKDSHNNFLS